MIVPGVDMWFFGENQLGDDSTGLLGRGLFFWIFSMSLFKKARILMFFVSKTWKSSVFLGKINLSTIFRRRAAML